MKNLYLVLAILGFVLPYYFFASFLLVYGFDLQLFFQQLFANDIATFFVMDLVIAAIVFWVFMIQEARRVDIGNSWIFVVFSLLISFSFAFPLFLYYRERKLES
jgi:hypothetical protein